MRSARLVVLAAVAAGSLVLTAAAFATLPPAGTFDSPAALDGWAFPPFDAGELAFDLRDAGGDAASGSMQVTNASSLPLATTVRASRCLGPAVPGARYHVAAALLLARGQAIDGEVRLVLDWSTSVECISVAAVRMELDETHLVAPGDGWMQVEAVRFAPYDARSVALRIEVTKRGDVAPDPTRPLDVLVDDLRVRPFAARLYVPLLSAD
jgi:hypothetical protein